MTIAEKISDLKQQLPAGVQLIAVSKTQPPAVIFEAYQAGQMVFGENKVQELSAKQATLPADIQWHFIGHLQSNKVKKIAAFASLIHSVDSLKLLEEINRQALIQQRKIRVLLQFYIAEEESKFGFSYDEACRMLDSKEFSILQNVQLAGVMGMASFTRDQNRIRTEFKTLRKYFSQLKSVYFSSDDVFKEISMGMSDDWHIAIEEGSTMIRLGTAIFGSRVYLQQIAGQ